MPQSKGRVARQTHVGVPAGLVEEEHGRHAFAGPVSHLYRTAPPTAWVDVDGPLRPLAGLPKMMGTYGLDQLSRRR